MKSEIFWIPGPWLGRLGVVTRPRGGDWLEDEAEGWRLANIQLLVSLLEPEEAEQLELLDEAQIAKAHGVDFISFPIPDRGTPASLTGSLQTLTVIAGALERGENVAIHCRQGIGRSGMIAAGVLMTSGMDANRAMETVSSARGIQIPETREQGEWIRRLPAGKIAVIS